MYFNNYLIIYSKINLLSIKKERTRVKSYLEILEIRFMIRYFSLPKESELKIGSFTYEFIVLSLLLLLLF